MPDETRSALRSRSGRCGSGPGARSPGPDSVARAGAGSAPAARSRSRLTDQFEIEARRCASLEDLRLLLDEVAGELGFRYFALLHHRSMWPRPRRLIRLDNYPPGWAEELLSRHDIAADPVHLASLRTNAGFRWEELGHLLPLSPAQRDILERSGHHGLGPGFTVPANVPGEPSGSCSFAVARGRPLPERRLMCAELIGVHAFRAARRIHGLAEMGVAPRLSRRELQCLRLVAAGKTDWEIAHILAISVETARQYVKRARAAYDVVSRAQLVACGLRDGRVSFDEAIPPDEGMG
ncbi:MAG: LuxR family transcriptional regulator [Sphingomonas sp.]|nr:LuxR family transcriptional regulator [Sphingomonas sp.]